MASPDAANLAPRAATVHRIADDLGFALVGVAPAEPTEYADVLRDWLAAGKHGEMDYLEKHTPKRVDPRELLPGAKSIICVADVYEQGTKAQRDEGTEGESNPKSAIRNPKSPHGKIARYAWGDDYHDVMKKRLHALADALRTKWPEYDYRACVDTAPVLEREHAMRAGLGWVGKHTLLIHPQLGSWLLLGEIVTTLPIESSEEAGWPGRTVPPTDHCGTCTRCLDACPTQCITPYSLDATRCISYLTIEHRGGIDESLHEAMGDWIAGCDVCQEVCPHNEIAKFGMRNGEQHSETHRESAAFSALPHSAFRTPRSNYAPRPPAPAVSLLDVLDWTAEDRRRVLRGSALKRIKLDMWKRNALIAAGSHLAENTAPALLAKIEQLADDVNESETVRETARQVLRRLN